MGIQVASATVTGDESCMMPLRDPWEGAASKMTLEPGDLPCRCFGTSVERGAGTGFAFS